jgi:PNKP (polynucleotide 5'-kinase/3'-phosphatase) family adenylyltransferase-like protein
LRSSHADYIVHHASSRYVEAQPGRTRVRFVGVEKLERFVAREPLRRVHERAFAVPALESEPEDPRL